MKPIYTYISAKQINHYKISSLIVAFFSCLLFNRIPIQAQVDSVRSDTLKNKAFFRQHPEASAKTTNQDAIYNRPFIGISGTRTAVGGYIEGNTNYFSEDGISDGFSMELRRFNIFLYSAISQRIKFLSEIEFEHGTKEISLETAQLDFEINPSLIIRGGIILPQVGIFNANHDSPNWEFIERPLSSTKIIPSTLSEVGFGIHGKFFPGNNIISYNAYFVNGLQSGIILNENGRTFIPSGKNKDMFAVDNNGLPMMNFRLSLTNRFAGEIGLAYYGGVYNNFRKDGFILDRKRRLNTYAIDFSIQIFKCLLQGEYVLAYIDVPEELLDIYGDKQNGGFVEIIYPVIQRKILSYDKAKVNINARVEKIDYNNGKFSTTKHNIADEHKAIVSGISFRPTPSTVFRFNYRYHWESDALGNPPVKIAGLQFGISSYF